MGNSAPDAMDMDVTDNNSMRSMTIQVTRMALLCLLVAIPAQSQIVETVGSRALGMGGAFVAVASDSSATWWNPAGLAAGPFVDIAWGKALIDTPRRQPAWRHRAAWAALGTPPIGVSVYRFRITDIQPFAPTELASDDRQDSRVGVRLRSLSVSQLGVTLVRTITQGVHVGTTLKYVRGTVDIGQGDSRADPVDLLDAAGSLDGGSAESRFDLDLGVLGVAGPFRIGALVRNVREPAFGSVALVPGDPETGVRLPRQARVGIAFVADDSANRPTIALDGDIRPYDTPTGERQVVALGAEHWFLARRLGVRAGGRFNTRGARERAATVGATVALRGGLLLDGHATGGGAAVERGWGLAARVSF
jgi:hypothetical protein